MENTSETHRVKVRELEYQKERIKIQFFEKLVSYFVDHAERHGTTKRRISERLGKDPAVISRWLSHPTNLTIDSISELLYAMDAEPELHIEELGNAPPANYMHPWMIEYRSNAGNQKSTPRISTNLERTLTNLHVMVARGESHSTAPTRRINAGHEEATNA